MRFSRFSSEFLPRSSLFTLFASIFIFFGGNIQVSAYEYTFCAKNVLYTFSSEACPGGILLKNSLQIDEPCHCFESDLKIYSSCNDSSEYHKGPSTPSGCSLPLFQQGESWNGNAMMLIPGDFGKANRTARDSCFGMPKSCNATPETVVTKIPQKIAEYMQTIKMTQTQKVESGANKTSSGVTENNSTQVVKKGDSAEGEDDDDAEDDEEDDEEESSSQENSNSNKTLDNNVTKKPTNLAEKSTTTTTTTKTTTTEKPQISQTLVSNLPMEKQEVGLEIGPVINIASPDLNVDSKIEAAEIKPDISGLNKTTIDPIQEKSFNDITEDDETLRLARDGATNAAGNMTKDGADAAGGGEKGEEGNNEDEDDSGADSEEGEDEKPDNHNGDGFELTPDPADPTDVVALLRHIQGVKEGQIPDPPPNTKTFQLIKQSLKIVQRLTPNDVIRDEHLYEAYLAFRYLFAPLDEDESTDRHFTTNVEDFNAILLALQDCESSVPTFLFKTSGPLHKIEALYIPHETGVTEQAIAIPADRAHKPDNEDYVIGIMWKIIDIVHSTCYSEFKWNSPSTQFDYFVAIEDLFMKPAIQKRWNEPQLLSTESEGKLELISHPDIKLLMENLDSVDAAAHSTFGFEYYLKKPKGSASVAKVSGSTGQSSSPAKTRRRKRKSRKIHKEHLSRKKREEPSSIVPASETDWSVFEIWGGQAYCLQKQNTDLPAGGQNSLPNTNELCKNTLSLKSQ